MRCLNINWYYSDTKKRPICQKCLLNWACLSLILAMLARLITKTAKVWTQSGSGCLPSPKVLLYWVCFWYKHTIHQNCCVLVYTHTIARELAVFSCFGHSLYVFHPRSLESITPSPTPAPMPKATISIWIGNDNISALTEYSPVCSRFGSSDILETSILSTMLYIAWSTMDTMIGMPIFNRTASTHPVPMIFSSFFWPIFSILPASVHKKRAARGCLPTEFRLPTSLLLLQTVTYYLAGLPDMMSKIIDSYHTHQICLKMQYKYYYFQYGVQVFPLILAVLLSLCRFKTRQAIKYQWS